MDISLLMVVRDEVEALPEAIDRARDACAELVVVDTGSTDGTVELLRRRYGIEALRHIPNGDNRHDIVRARNVGVARATRPWVLVLDADEVLSPDAACMLRELPDEQPVDGFFGAWRNRRNGRTFDDYKLFLFRRGRGIDFRGRVHAVPQTSMRRLGLAGAWLEGLEVEHRRREGRGHRLAYEIQLRRGIAETPHWIRYHWFLGYSLLQRGAVAEGEALLEHAARSCSTDFPVECLNAGLVLAAQRGRRGDATGAAEAVARMRAFLPLVAEDFEVGINAYDSWLDAAEAALRRHAPGEIPERLFAY
jgi:hypothetical protein